MPSVTGCVTRFCGCFNRKNLSITTLATLHGMYMQGTEAATECLMGLLFQVLVPEHQNRPVQKSLVNLLELSLFDEL